MDTQMELQALFFSDCTQRIRRASQIISNWEEGLTAGDYDCLYQEFDTLYGGAKAICFSELERFFFTMASYVRFLKRCNTNSVSKRDVAVIAEGIALFYQNGSKELSDFNSRNESLSLLIDQLDIRMQSYGGK